MQHSIFKYKINHYILLNIKNKTQISQNSNFIQYCHYKININKYLYLILINIAIYLLQYYFINNFSLKLNFYANFFFYYY